jgi:diguanylate cyclase (GGDEF)-like protein
VLGAAMMRLVDSHEPCVRQALNVCMLGFALLGLALGGIFFVGTEVGPLGQALIASGTLLSVASFSWGFAMLAGQRRPGWGHVLAVSAACLVAGTLGLWTNQAVLTRVFILALSALGGLMLWCSRRFLLRPRDNAERLLGVAVVVLAASTWARAMFTFSLPGPYPVHLMHVPQWLMPPLAVCYGVLPIVAATLLLSLVNARLRHHLNVRATTDELTGAMTRRALRELAPGLMAGHRHAGRRLTLLMLDLDHFKTINDQFGHASGDLVLQHTAATLRAQLRPDALLARYGGEEFVALLPVDELRTARQIAERLREAVATTEWRAADGRKMTVTVTVSVGVSLLGEDEAFDAALQRADEALYRAKRDGRNQVQVGLAAA